MKYSHFIIMISSISYSLHKILSFLIKITIIALVVTGAILYWINLFPQYYLSFALITAFIGLTLIFILSKMFFKIYIYLIKVNGVLKTSFHETGHVLAAYKFCPELIKCVSIEEEYISGNRLLLHGFFDMKEYDLSSYWSSIVTVSLAGELAERMFFPSTKNNTANTDISLALYAFSSSDYSLDSIHLICEEKTYELIDFFSCNIKIISKLALILAFMGSLNSTVIKFLLKTMKITL